MHLAFGFQLSTGAGVAIASILHGRFCMFCVFVDLRFRANKRALASSN